MRQLGRSMASDPGTTAKEFLRTLLRRRWVVLAMFLAVSITGTLVTLRMTPMYESVGKIAVFREAQDPLGFQQSAVSDSTEDWDYSVALETQVRIIESDLIASTVIQNLDLAHNPDFNPKADKVARPPSGTHAEVTPEILQLFDEALAVEPVRNTRIIELRVRTKNPKLSADIVNNLLNVYQERNFRDRFESSMQASEWMSKQTADLKLKTEMAQEALVEYQKVNEILGVDEKQNITTVKLDELNKELTKAETERMQKQATFEQLRAGQYDQIPSLSQNLLIQKLIEKRSELQRALADASVQLGPEFPRVKQLQQQLTESERSLETEMKSIASRLQTEYREAQRREQLVRASLEDQKRQANLLNEKAIQYNILKREAESNRQLYEGVMQKMKEASISAGLRSNNIRVVDVGRVPSKPVSPKVLRLIALAMFLGLVSGIAMAFIFEVLDNTVRTPEELENDLNLPSLGIIPLQSDQLNALPGKEKTSLGMVARNEIALTSHSQPKSQVAEAYRALRTSLLLSSAGAPPQIIAVSSALPQEGKTTTCANLAIVMAKGRTDPGGGC